MTIFDRAFEHADDATAVTAARRIAQKVLDNPRADDAARSAALKVLNSDDATVSRAIPRAVAPAPQTSPNQSQSPEPLAAASTRGAVENSPGRTPWFIRAGADFIRGREKTADVSPHGIRVKGQMVENLFKKEYDALLKKDALLKNKVYPGHVVVYPSILPGVLPPASYDVVADTLPFAAAVAAAGIDDDNEIGALYTIGEDVVLNIKGPGGRQLSVNRVPIKKTYRATADDDQDEKRR